MVSESVLRKSWLRMLVRFIAFTLRVQPLEHDVVGLAQQQLCLQKMELFYESWCAVLHMLTALQVML